MIYRVQAKAGENWREILNTNVLGSAKVRATMLYLEGYTSRVIDAEGVTIVECGGRAVTPVTMPAEPEPEPEQKPKRHGFARFMPKCQECGKLFVAKRSDASSCSVKCRKRVSRREISRRSQV